MGCVSSAFAANLYPVSANGNVTRCCRIDTCGHRCGGVQGEAGTHRSKDHQGNFQCSSTCLGCVEPGCSSNRVEDLQCPVCLERFNGAQPAIRLTCGHVLHMRCVMDMLDTVDWRGREVTSASINCPLGCGKQIHHPLLEAKLEPLARVAAKAEQFAKNAAACDTEHSPEDYRIYQCHTCHGCFVGGLRQCEGGDAEDCRLVLCGKCRQKNGAKCKKHGEAFCLRKCNYCCQIATFVCAGGAHQYCTSCHISAADAFHKGQWQQWHNTQKVAACDPAKCPFSGGHPAGHTSAWRSACTECHRPPVVVTSSQPAASKVRIKCESPGCTVLAHAEPAPWNGWGRHCCSGCMRWASYSTMRPNPGCPPTNCHDCRCGKTT